MSLLEILDICGCIIWGNDIWYKMMMMLVALWGNCCTTLCCTYS